MLNTGRSNLVAPIYQNFNMQSEIHFQNDQPQYVKFLNFIERNPQVFTMFEKIAFELIRAGCKKIGGKLVWETLRYKVYTEVRKEDWEKYKLNNNLVAYFVRHFIKKNPEHENRFELRQLKSI